MSAGRYIKLLIALSLASSTLGVSFADDGPDALSSGNIHYREALFYWHQEEYFPAIVRLLAARQQRQFGQNKHDAELLLGRLSLAYGNNDDARQIFSELLASHVEPGVRDQSRVFLAGIRHREGDVAGAQSMLDSVVGELPVWLATEWRNLQIRIHTESGEFQLAVAELDNWPPGDSDYNYAKYNLGVGMVRSGAVDGGAEILNELGQLDSLDEELDSLRDKANLALGYAYLQNGQLPAARESLNRVRLDGPFSSQALLSAGWAEAGNERYQRALVPWMEIRDRDPFDPAVQESRLAIPYAMVRLGALNQAADQYSTAVAAFAGASLQIDSAVEYVRSGRMSASLSNKGGSAAVDGREGPAAFVGTPEWRSLYPFLASIELRERLESLRELGELRANLDTWQRSMDVFQHSLVDRELAYEQQWALLQGQLSQARFDDMVGRMLALDSRLTVIEKTSDALALATVSEFESWGKVTTVERHPAVDGPILEAGEVRDKVALLKGVLQWQLEEEFDMRLLRARDEFAKENDSLAHLLMLRRQIADGLHRDRLAIADLKGRVAVIAPQIDSLKTRIDAAILRLRVDSEHLMVEKLLAEKKQLEAYTAQAQFALAAIYDMAASRDGSGGVSR